jgi:hypothetical protein
MGKSTEKNLDLPMKVNCELQSSSNCLSGAQQGGVDAAA